MQNDDSVNMGYEKHGLRVWIVRDLNYLKDKGGRCSHADFHGT